MELEKFLVHGIIHFFVPTKCPPNSISNVTNDKNELRLKTVRLTSFQNAQKLQSISTFFKFVYPFLLLYLLCYLYLLFIHVLSSYFYVLLSLVAVLTV